MSANIYDLLDKSQKEAIQQVLCELSDSALSLDPNRIEDARKEFEKMFKIDNK